MTTSDKLREILDSNKTRCYDEDYGTMVIKTDSFGDVLSDLTALISEGYYPKEFVEWKDKNTLSDKISRTEVRYFLTDMDAPLDLMTLDELFNYWKENEQ